MQVMLCAAELLHLYERLNLKKRTSNEWGKKDREQTEGWREGRMGQTTHRRYNSSHCSQWTLLLLCDSVGLYDLDSCQVTGNEHPFLIIACVCSCPYQIRTDENRRRNEEQRRQRERKAELGNKREEKERECKRKKNRDRKLLLHETTPCQTENSALKKAITGTRKWQGQEGRKS